MSAERLDLVAQLLLAALAREPRERTEFLEQALGGDQDLRQEVESLLLAHEQAGSFLDAPPVDVASELLAVERAAAMVGHRVGPFQIETLLGSGGMGEVYRASDTRLGRTVAIKILPSGLSRNPELRQRLEREAQAISRLSHPNIRAIFDIGRHEDVDYLVMEYLEGKTLEDRLTRGALPFDEALRCGIEIAGALQAAHRQGITHRDIKPSNIMLVKGGCKVLDFGLAKFVPTAAALSTPITKTTAKGTILGTIPYMSPEQLEGQAADARSDIFAFGALLYEMMTGRRAFDGKSQASLITAIMSTAPPDVSTLQPLASPALDRLVRRCLEKDPEERWQTALDIKEELRWIEGSSREASSNDQRSKTTGRRAWIWAVASGLLGAATTAVVLRQDTNNQPDVTPFGIDWPDGVALADTPEFGGPAVSPDGSAVVFAGVRNGEVSLYLRRMNHRELRPLTGTEHAANPFWSHDSRRVGFFAEGKLRTVFVDGASPAETICEIGQPTDKQTRGATWNQNGDIVYAPTIRSALYRVSLKSKTPRPVTTLGPEDGQHLWPCFLPDGEHFLYLQFHQTRSHGAVYIGSLDSTTKPTEILPGHYSSVVYAANHLLYVKNGNLQARGFNAETLQWTGAEEIEVARSVTEEITSRALFSAGDGPLVYYGPEVSRVVKFNYKGMELESIGEGLRYFNIRLSSDGRRAAYTLRRGPVANSESRKLWVLDLEAKQPLAYNHDPDVGMVDLPVFSPNQPEVFFWGRMGKPAGVHRMSLRTGETARVIGPGFIPLDISPDGRYLLLKSRAPTGGGKLFYVELTPARTTYEPREFVKANHHEKQGRFSPDGQWVVYTSNELGKDHVYVRRFVSGEDKSVISEVEGGSYPAWIGHGDNLKIVYLSGTRTLMSVALERTGSMLKRKGSPERVFKPPESSLPSGAGDDYRWWEITADGQFVYAIVNQPVPVEIVKDWTARLKR